MVLDILQPTVLISYWLAVNYKYWSMFFSAALQFFSLEFPHSGKCEDSQQKFLSFLKGLFCLFIIMCGYPNFIPINLLHCCHVLYSDYEGLELQIKFQYLNKCV